MLRDGSTGDWIGTFAGHKGAVWSCRMDPTGYLAATASGDFSVQVWDAITGKSWRSYPHSHIVKTVDFSPNSEQIVTGGHEGLVRVFDLTKNDDDDHHQADNAATISDAECTRPTLEFAMDPKDKVVITKANWLSNTVVLVGGNDGKVRCFDITQQEYGKPGTPSFVLETKANAEIRDMEVRQAADTNAAVTQESAFSTSPSVLTVAAGDSVYFFDLDTTQTLLKSHKMPIHFRNEGGASLHPNGTRFVAGGSDLWVRVFDYQTGRELECLKGHHGPIRCLRYAPPHGKLFASGSEDGTIRLWKTTV